MGQVQGALAMAGKDDRPILLHLGDKIVKGEQDIAIGGIQRHLAFGLVGQKCANCRLSVARCPDFASRSKG